MSGWRPFIRPVLLILAVFCIPVIPWLLLGEDFERTVERWAKGEWTSAAQFWLIAGLLAGDILLPIPSSAVSTYGGGVLGMGRAALAAWLGMSVGAVGGYLLARLFGTSLADRLSGDDVRRMEAVVMKYGAAALVVTRALPILAEACVLLVGMIRMPWRVFLPPVLLANLAVALTYAAFGAWFAERDALPAAVVASGAVPLLVALLVRRRLSLAAPEPPEDKAADAPDGG